MSAAHDHDPALLALFEEAIYEVSRRRFEGLSPGRRIAELGVDSVSLLEAIGVLEEETGVTLPDEALTGVETVGDLLAVIQTRRG